MRDGWVVSIYILNSDLDADLRLFLSSVCPRLQSVPGLLKPKGLGGLVFLS